MKDERKIFWICLMLAAATILFAIKASAQQTGKFSVLILKDRHGEETRQLQSSITLLPGKLVVSEGKEKWEEKILLQSKNQDTCHVETNAGWYVLVLEGECLKRAYLRSNVGADRIYTND